LGEADLGGLLGLGRAPDDDVAAGADLHGLPDSAPVGGGAHPAGRGLRRGFNLRHGGHPDRLHGEPMVADAASGAGAQRRRLHRPQHAVVAVLYVFRHADGVLVPGAAASASGRAAARDRGAAAGDPRRLGRSMEENFKWLWAAFSIAWALHILYVYSLGSR